jgi:hypothetical protein
MLLNLNYFVCNKVDFSVKNDSPKVSHFFYLFTSGFYSKSGKTGNEQLICLNSCSKKNL